MFFNDENEHEDSYYLTALLMSLSVILPIFLGIMPQVNFLINLWIVWIFSDNIEYAMGRKRFILFVLSVMAIAVGVQLLSHRITPMPFINMEYLCAAMMGAYVRFFPNKRIRLTFLGCMDSVLNYHPLRYKLFEEGAGVNAFFLIWFWFIYIAFVAITGLSWYLLFFLKHPDLVGMIPKEDYWGQIICFLFAVAVGRYLQDPLTSIQERSDMPVVSHVIKNDLIHKMEKSFPDDLYGR